MTVPIVILIVGVLVVLRERSIDAERRRWEQERAGLLNRINPATAQAIPGVVDDGVLPQPPADSAEWWDQFQDKFTVDR